MGTKELRTMRELESLETAAKSVKKNKASSVELRILSVHLNSSLARGSMYGEIGFDFVIVYVVCHVHNLLIELSRGCSRLRPPGSRLSARCQRH